GNSEGELFDEEWLDPKTRSQLSKFDVCFFEVPLQGVNLNDPFCKLPLVHFEPSSVRLQVDEYIAIIHTPSRPSNNEKPNEIVHEERENHQFSFQCYERELVSVGRVIVVNEYIASVEVSASCGSSGGVMIRLPKSSQLASSSPSPPSPIEFVGYLKGSVAGANKHVVPRLHPNMRTAI
ncbi:hypothetical protein HDU76_004326, partial [Blyttiomyces sp. JEL0837]